MDIGVTGTAAEVTPSAPVTCVADHHPGAPVDTLTSVPDDVLTALGLLAAPERELAATMAGLGDTTAEWAAEELALVTAAERVRAWVDLTLAGAVNRFREAIGAEVQMQWDHEEALSGAKPRWAVTQEADAVTVDELCLATGWSESQARRTLAVSSTADGRTRGVLQRLGEGSTTFDRASRIIDDTRDCAADDVLVITERVLAPMPDGSTPSHRTFLRRLRRQLLLHRPDLAGRREDALTRRCAVADLHDDGTGTLTVTGETTRVVAALDRVDGIARSLRTGGDSRTLGQLRSDVALDLLLVGWPVAPEPSGTTAGTTSGPTSGPTAGTTSGAASGTSAGTTSGAASGTSAGTTSGAGAGTTSGTASGDQPAEVGVTEAPTTSSGGTAGPEPAPAPSALVDIGPWFTLSVAPAATVHVVVSLTTLMGLDDAVAELPAHGDLPADQARQLAMTEGSVWRRLVTDPITGAALDLSTKRYRPTRQMADTVNALDGTCRAPGCVVAAARCDLDHSVAWPRGETTVKNLRSTHRRHHNHKTRGLWHCTTDADGVVTWHTVAGRDYVTYRYRYHDPTRARPEDDIDRPAVTPDPPF